MKLIGFDKADNAMRNIALAGQRLVLHCFTQVCAFVMIKYDAALGFGFHQVSIITRASNGTKILGNLFGRKRVP